MSAAWTFSIDRGGTFTDIVARAPDGRLVVRTAPTIEHYEMPSPAWRDLEAGGADRIGAMGTTAATPCWSARRAGGWRPAGWRRIADRHPGRPDLPGNRYRPHDRVVEIDEE